MVEEWRQALYLWSERPLAFRLKALRSYREQTILFTRARWAKGTEVSSISAAAAWSMTVLGLRDSSKHYELLSSTLPICAHGKYSNIHPKLQIQSRAFLGHFYSCKIKVSLFLIMGSLSHQEKCWFKNGEVVNVLRPMLIFTMVLTGR